MAQGGWAFDWPRCSGGYYADDETHAEVNHLGLWEHREFVAPRLFRKAKREQCMLDVLESHLYAVIEEQLEAQFPDVVSH